MEFSYIELFRAKEVDDMYKMMVNMLYYFLDKYVPKIECKTRKKKVKWMKKDVYNHINNKKGIEMP